jgi:hypothetical protein
MWVSERDPFGQSKLCRSTAGRFIVFPTRTQPCLVARWACNGVASVVVVIAPLNNSLLAIWTR